MTWGKPWISFLKWWRGNYARRRTSRYTNVRSANVPPTSVLSVQLKLWIATAVLSFNLHLLSTSYMPRWKESKPRPHGGKSQHGSLIVINLASSTFKLYANLHASQVEMYTSNDYLKICSVRKMNNIMCLWRHLFWVKIVRAVVHDWASSMPQAWL